MNCRLVIQLAVFLFPLCSSAQIRTQLEIGDEQAIDYFALKYEGICKKLWEAAADGRLMAWKDDKFRKSYTKEQVKFELGARKVETTYFPNPSDPYEHVDTTIIEYYNRDFMTQLRLIPIKTFKNYTLDECASIQFFDHEMDNVEPKVLFSLMASQMMGILDEGENWLLRLILLNFISNSNQKNKGIINKDLINKAAIAWLHSEGTFLYADALNGKISAYTNDSLTSKFNRNKLYEIGSYKAIKQFVKDPKKPDERVDTCITIPFNTDSLHGIRVSYEWKIDGNNIWGSIRAIAPKYTPNLMGIELPSQPMFWVNWQEDESKLNKIATKRLTELSQQSLLVKMDTEIHGRDHKSQYKR